ncbi:MAG TPA: tripartite tricarboxylate transporter TctB family protein, partial [Limnochordales bacterium]
MRPNRDQWAALLLLGVAGLYLWGTFQYGDEGPPGMPTARTFPLLLDGALAVLALVLGIGASLGGVGRPQPAHGGAAAPDSLPFGQGEGQANDVSRSAQELPGAAREPGPPDGSALRRVALAVALLAGYLAALPRAGFLVSTVA